MTHRAAVLLALALALASLAPPATAADAPRKDEVSLEGYAEWRDGDLLIVDGQRVRLAPDGRFKGKAEARDLPSVPLGYEVSVKGRRTEDGVVLAREIEAEPNGVALFEKQVLKLTDEAESKYRRAGRYYTTGKGSKTVGRLRDSGAEVERVREILDRVAPPYVDTQRVRAYVIDNDDWNAFAMGNYSIYVYSGLLRDMDDDEVAIVLGHELAHATHEHTRRRFKKAMFVQLAAIGVTAASRDVDDKKKRVLVNLIAQFTAMALVNGYGRDLEDQADRVGLRYAYEAGYNVGRGPELWRRFAAKYGEKGKVANFFLGNHSLASQRAVHLEQEMALNYRGGPRLARAPRPRPARVEREERTERAERERENATTARPAARRTQRDEIREGMTPEEVRDLLGAPEREVVFGTRTRWSYPDLTVVFRRGKVVEVRF
jgi:Zn-dependent protease with chaperone function